MIPALTPEYRELAMRLFREIRGADDVYQGCSGVLLPRVSPRSDASLSDVVNAVIQSEGDEEKTRLLLRRFALK